MCEKNGCTRRHVLAGFAAATAAALVVRGPAVADDHVASVSPDQAMALLKEGHQRFISKAMKHPDMSPERIAETYSGGQHPFATFISCSDSRVPVELIFDQGIGDLFIVRVAGNIIDDDGIGTCEYGAGHLAVPLIVVMGHTKCGAVTAVATGAKLYGHVGMLAERIKPAVARASATGATGDDLVALSIRENVKESIAVLLKESEELTHLVAAGKLKIVGAIYHLENGQVDWL